DVFGRITRVDEPDNQGNLPPAGQPVPAPNPSETPTASFPSASITYQYDPLDNLKTIVQGSQTRSFIYDSLSRLTSMTNPESSTISYTYDSNGNLKTRLDSRHVKTVYDYDALDRMINKCYRIISSGLGLTTCTNNTEPADPNTSDVAFTYDNLPNSKGQRTKVAAGNTTSENLSHDSL